METKHALLEALRSLMATDANANIERLKNELFKAAPEIPAMARAAIRKAEGQ